MNTARTLTPEQRRRKQIAGIHVLASKKLKLDDGTYRALLLRVTGKRSAADLDTRQRAAVLNELRRLANEGAKGMRQALPDAPQNVRDEVQAMIGKIGAILEQDGRSWAYAHGLANKMFNVTRTEWLRADQMHRLVGALQIDQNRRAKRG